MNARSISTDRRPASRRTIAAQAVAAAGILVTPCVYSFHFESFSDAKLTFLALAGIALACLYVPEVTVRPRPVGRALALGLVALGFVVVVQAPFISAVPAYTLADAGAFALVAATAFLFSSAFGWTDTGRERLLLLVAGSALPVAALGLLQYAGALPGLFPVFPGYDQRVYSVFGNQDLFGGYLAIALPLWLALVAVRRIPMAAGAVAMVLLLPAITLSGSRSAWLAALVGCIVALALSTGEKRRRWVLPIVLAAFVLAITVVLAPGATVDRFRTTFSPSDTGYHVRGWIWDATWRMFSRHPILGVGLGNFGFEIPPYLGEAAREYGPGATGPNQIPVLHAHSDLLEIGAETGLVGLVVLGALIALLVRRRGPGWGALAAYGVFALVNTTMHSPPHVFVFLLLVLSLLSRDPAPAAAGGRLPIRWARPTMPVVYIALASFAVVSTIVPSWQLGGAEIAYDRGDQSGAEARYQHAINWPWPNYRAAKDLAILCANEGRNQEAAKYAKQARDGIDTGEIHMLLGMLAERRGDDRAARAAYRRCLDRWPAYAPAWDRLIALSPPDERATLRQEEAKWVPETVDVATVPQAPADSRLP